MVFAPTVAGASPTARQHRPGDIALPAIVALRFTVLEFDTEDARHSTQIRAQLAEQGAPIGPYDILIAG